MNMVPARYERSKGQLGRSSELIKSVGQSLVQRANKVLASTDQLPLQVASGKKSKDTLRSNTSMNREDSRK